MTRDDISTFIEAGDAEAFGLTLDTAHLAKAGVTEISDLIYEYRDYLHNLHLQDFCEGKFVSLGEGDLDYRAILDMVQSFNFSGWVCVEDQSNASVEEALQLCEKSLRNYDI